MPPASDSDPLLTLEPLLDAVREGLSEVGWALSGLQKTTSYEFEGRWAGETSRSAFLFFHRKGLPDWISIDVFLDETTRGLKGNVALVVEGPELGKLSGPEEILNRLAAACRRTLPRGYQTPLTLRYRLGKITEDPAHASTEFRFKLHIPSRALKAGHQAVVALAASTARSFQEILRSAELRLLIDFGGEGG
jgi:hypothetical protein